MSSRRRLACDLAAFLVPAIVYVASASHEPASWDTAELQGVPYILGITHPTGFPFYVLLGWVWSHAIPLGTIAFRLNVFSGVALAAAAALAYACALELGAWPPVALAASLWFSFTQNVWSHGARAEAQDLAVACEAFALYAFLRWMRGHGDRWFLAAFAGFGLGIAAHPNAIWLAPGLAAGAIVARSRPTARLLAGALALTAAGLLLYLYLPLRSAYVVAHGLDPAHVLPGAGGGIFWNYNDPSTPAGFVRALTGTESDAPHFLLASLNPLHAQDALWAFFSAIGEQFGAFALIVVLAGAVSAWKRDWRTTLFLCIACTAALLFSVTYPNEADVGRYRMLALWLAVPLLGALAPSGGASARSSSLRALLAAFLSAGALISLVSHRSFFTRAPREGGRWVIDAVRPFVPPGGVVVVDGWIDATSLAYGAYVDQSLPGRTVVSGWDRADMGNYRAWASGRPVFVLTDPHVEGSLPGATPAARLDAYHELFKVER
ncbi:MAG: DUF2723 domain-containing protein [Candidatus Tumulicola sp.]